MFADHLYRNSRRWILGAASAWALATSAADWPRFRGPNADGIAPPPAINLDWNQQPPAPVWTVALNDQGFAGPAVANGKVIIVDHLGDKDVVRALDFHDGHTVWTRSYPDAAKANNGFTRATPAIDCGRVYCLSRWGILACLAEATGKVIWLKNIVTEFQGEVPQYLLSWSPLVDGNQLILLPGGKTTSVIALDKVTGQVLWRGGGAGKPDYATPVAATINGQRQFIVMIGARVLGLEAATGRELWQMPWETYFNINVSTPVVVGNQIFLTSAYKHGGALITVTEQGATTTWETREMQSTMSTAIHHDGYLYGLSGFNTLACLELATGKLMWRQSRFNEGGLVGVPGALIAVTGNEGQAVLVELTPARYHELGRFTPLGGQSWTAPIVADGKLIIRNKSTLGCFELLPATAATNKTSTLNSRF